MSYTNTVVINFDKLDDPRRGEITCLLMRGVLDGWCVHMADGDTAKRPEDIDLDSEIDAIEELIDRTVGRQSVAAPYIAHWRDGEMSHRSAASILVSVKANADMCASRPDVRAEVALAYQDISDACGRVIVDVMERML